MTKITAEDRILIKHLRNLQLKTYKRVIGQKLNENVKLKRLQRSRQLLERFLMREVYEASGLQTTRHSPLPLQLILKMIVFIPLKQRNVKFLKGDLYDNVTISAAVSWYQLVCLELGKLVLCSLNKAPK